MKDNESSVDYGVNCNKKPLKSVKTWCTAW